MAENKTVTSKHNEDHDKREDRTTEMFGSVVVLEDCGAGTMGHVTTYVTIVKVNNGTLNAVGVFKTG
jgi:hypothetical protein